MLPRRGRSVWRSHEPTGPLALDAPQWQQAASHELTIVPPLNRLPRKTTLRLLYDSTNLYIRTEAELEPDGPAEFPAWNRDRLLSNQEAFDIYLAPQPAREIFYRLAVGANAASKYDAVSGLISDAMDPRHGKDDPTWNGDWQAESRIDTKEHRWQALITIPFKTLAAEPPAPGTDLARQLRPLPPPAPREDRPRHLVLHARQCEHGRPQRVWGDCV